MKVRFTAITRHEISTIDVSPGTVIIGRDRACDHTLDDPALERRHLAVTVGAPTVSLGKRGKRTTVSSARAKSGPVSAPNKGPGDGETIQLTDLQTRTGTFVNSRRVSQTLLGPGDRIRCGDTVLIVSVLPDGLPETIEDAPSGPAARRSSSLIQDDERFFIRIAREWELLDRPRMRTILMVKNEDRLLRDEHRVEEICVRRGYLTVSQVREIISIWERIVVRCRSCNSVYTPKDLERARTLRCPSCQAPLRGGLGFPGEGDVEQRAAAALPETESRYLKPGETFGGCQVERFVAEGGSAEVYTAIHLALNVRVAIKVLKGIHAVDGERAHRFVEEARRVARLDHPHIVGVHNVGFQDGRYFIIYQYVEGRTLASVLADQGRLAPDRIRYIVAATASGLLAAHRHGLVHGDVKPENILVGRNRVVKITDFGVAHEQAASSDSLLAGSYLYQAPEQEAGGPVDERCDIYALGLVMRFMLLGEPPPEDHRYVDLPAPHELDPSASEPLSRIASRMLQKDPDDRYRSMDDVITALRESIPKPGSATSTPHDPPRRRLIRRLAQVTAVVLLLLGAGLVGALVTMPAADRTRLIGRFLGRIEDVGGQITEALDDEARASSTDRSSPLSGPADSARSAPPYRPPQEILDALREAFAKRNFSEVRRLVVEEIPDADRGAAAYRDRVLAFTRPLLGYTRLVTSLTHESYLRDRPLRFQEFAQFVYPYNKKYVDAVRPGWYSGEIMSERLEDLEYGGNDDDYFPYASQSEAVAYCHWLMDHPEISGSHYQFRLPLSHEVKAMTSMWNFWLGDSTNDQDTKLVYTKRSMVVEENFDGIRYQPMIRLVLDVPVEELHQFDKTLNGAL